MARRVATRGRPGKTIDFKSWDAIPSINISTGAAGTVIGGSVAFTLPATILRVRGMVNLTIDNESVEPVDTFVALGLAIVSTDAATLGATAMPDPAGDADFPWLWWMDVPLTMHEMLAAVPQSITQIGSARVLVDSKAMRKVKPAQSLIWVLSHPDAIQVDIDIALTRVLIGT